MTESNCQDPEGALTAGTLIDGARMYASAADAVNTSLPNSLHVLSHLLGTSIELALKAYIRNLGHSKNELKAIGHDLGKLFDIAVQNGMEWTGSRSFILRVAGHNYRERLFVYPEAGIKTVIMPCRLRQMADELIRLSFIAIHGEEILIRADGANLTSRLNHHKDQLNGQSICPSRKP